MKTEVKSFIIIIIPMILVGISMSQAYDTRSLAERSSGVSIIERRVKKFGRSADKVIKYRIMGHPKTNGGSWNRNDWEWMTYGFQVRPDILLIKALTPALLDCPMYSNYLPMSNGFTWDRWDGWSKIALIDGADSLYYKFDTKGRVIENYLNDGYKILVTFDELDRLTRMEFFEQESDLMVITAKHVITYANDRPREMIKELYQKGLQAVEKFKYSLSYDDTNNITEIVEFKWNDASGNWERGDTKEIISYTPDGKIKEDTDYQWVESPGSWVGHSKTLFSYNGNGQLTEEIEQGSSQRADLWVNRSKDTFEYNAGGSLVNHMYFSWNDEDSSWGDCLFRNESLYNADGLLTEDIVYDTDEITGELTEIDKVVYQYESDGNLKEEVWYYREDKEWKKDVKYEYTYDTDGKPAMKSDYLYEVSTGEWELEYESAVMFEYNTGVKQTVSKGNSVNYQIQSMKNGFSVTVPGCPSGRDLLTVYDLQGRIILRQKPIIFQGNSVYTLPLRVRNGDIFAKKVYILTVRKDRTLFTHRLINIE